MAALLALAGCTRSASPDREADLTPLFTDADLLAAQDARAHDVRELSFGLGRILADVPETDATRVRRLDARVLPDGRGVVTFVQNDRRRPTPWRVYSHDQASDERTLVYQGVREVEGAASSGDGNTVVLTARSPTEDLEIYRLTLSPRSVQRLTFTSFDERNLSLSSDGSRIVWKGVGAAGQRSVYVRTYQDATTFVQQRIAQPLDQVQPSVSGSGDFIALVQLQSNGDEHVLRYDLTTATYDVVYRTALAAGHPSVSDTGDTVAFVLREATQDKILTRDMSSSALLRHVINRFGIDHPHISGDGTLLAYTLTQLGPRDLGGPDIFVRNLVTQEQTRMTTYPTSEVDHLQPYWSTLPDTASGDVARFRLVVNDVGAVSTTGATVEPIGVPLPLTEIEVE